MEPDQNNASISLLISINDKVDELKDQVHGVSIVQTRIESDLKYHIKRTDLLEQHLGTLNNKVEPLHSAKRTFFNIAKVIGFLFGILAGVVAAYKAFKF